MQRAFEVFDTNNNGEVNIKEFIQGLSKFSVGDPMEKTRFAFRYVATPYAEVLLDQY